MLDDANVIIESMESQFEHLKDSTVLFELPIPEKSLLLKCRREVKLLKVHNNLFLVVFKTLDLTEI